MATANEDLNHLGVAKPITLPGPSYRAERIAAVLGSRSDWTVEQVGRLQMDVLSLQAQRFLAVLAPLLDDDKRFTKLCDGTARTPTAAAPSGSRRSTSPPSRRS